MSIAHNHNTVSPAGNQSEYPVSLSGNTTSGHVPFGTEENASNNFTQQETAHLTQAGHTHPGASAHSTSSGSAAITEIVGKIEHAVGSLLHSTALKEKGIMKEQQAASMKLEAQEINRAEILEQEAIKARERAAGHGASADLGKAIPAAPAGTFAGNSGAMPGVMPTGPNLGGHSII